MSGRLVTEAARARAEEQSLVAKAQAEQLRMEEEVEDALVRRQRALMRYESHMVGCSLQQPHPSRAHAPLKTCCMYVCVHTGDPQSRESRPAERSAGGDAVANPYFRDPEQSNVTMGKPEQQHRPASVCCAPTLCLYMRMPTFNSVDPGDGASRVPRLGTAPFSLTPDHHTHLHHTTTRT